MQMPLPIATNSNDETGSSAVGVVGDSQASKAASSNNPFASMTVTAKNFVPVGIIAQPTSSISDQ